MAALYFNEQLIAKSGIPGILPNQLINEEIVITYPHKKNKYYTAIIYDQDHIHALVINIVGDEFESGDILVEYEPFQSRMYNYNGVIYIYEQLGKIRIPNDDFDMEIFVQQY